MKILITNTSFMIVLIINILIDLAAVVFALFRRGLSAQLSISRQSFFVFELLRAGHLARGFNKQFNGLNKGQPVPVLFRSLIPVVSVKNKGLWNYRNGHNFLNGWHLSEWTKR